MVYIDELMGRLIRYLVTHEVGHTWVWRTISVPARP